MTGTIEVIKRCLAKVRRDPRLSDTLHESTDLVGEVGLDSLEMLQFMLEIEAALPIVIDFDKLDYSYLRSIGALATFLDAMPPRDARG